MQRIDEDCQVRLAGVARTDEDGQWAQFDFRSRNRAEIGNRQFDGLAIAWLAHVAAVYRLLSLPPPEPARCSRNRTARSGRRARRRRRAAIPDGDAELRAVAATTLDRMHAATLLQANGHANALRALLKAEHERGPDFPAPGQRLVCTRRSESEPFAG